MRSLTLLRHARTELESATGRDLDRELTAAGRQDAERLGREIRELGLDYDAVLVSPARRAVQTVECVGGLPPAIEEGIYNASADELLDIVRGVPAEMKRLMLVGHNPGFEHLAALLAPGSVHGMSTCTLVEIDFPVDDWRQVGPGAGRLVRIIDPKQLD